MNDLIKKRNYSAAVISWLAIVCLLVFAMVIIGGLTRLTESGLSMVEWKPLLGSIPPLSEQQWLEVFHKYQQYPQYRLLNHGMSLHEFKYIFYWEFFHRLLGRLIGIVYLIPFIFFLKAQVFSKTLSKRLWLGLALGGLQGLMGWYMVKSGLIDNPFVSHFRLAAHFGLALLIFCFLFWQILLVSLPTQTKHVHAFSAAPSIWIFFTTICFQILYGAFTAGLDAGLGYNTFPKMNGEWVPEALAKSSMGILSLLFEKVGVQFVHRYFAFVVIAVFIWLIYSYLKRSHLYTQLYRNALVITSMVLIAQFSLGVYTLLNAVPIAAASFHQAGAFALLSCGLVLVYLSRNNLALK